MADDTSIPTTPASARRHDLDALRAFAMLLGIALHAALSFMDIPWPAQDRHRQPWFGVFVVAVHGFRMPLFFMISGYFSAMLLRRRGLGGLLRQRTTRILIPLLLGCVTVVPLTWAVLIVVMFTQGSRVSDDPASSLWAAAAHGDERAVRAHIAAGADLDRPDGSLLTSPLGWAVIADSPETVGLLLREGADPNARFGDDNTVLHTAAFFGRVEAVRLLLDAGADPIARNTHGETPLDALARGKDVTNIVAGLMGVEIDYEKVRVGKWHIAPILEEAAGQARAEAGQSGAVDEPTQLRRVLAALLIELPLFHHLWFLWFLCWYIAGMAVVAAATRGLRRLRTPAALMIVPICLLWLVPLTMLTQSLQSGDGGAPPFGADTSAGLVPMPRVLAHYAVFFYFGVLVYGVPAAAERLGRGWWIQLPLALALLPAALGLAFDADWAVRLIEDRSTRRLLADAAQSLYVWLSIFGLMGLFVVALSRERPRIRYVSDSSYWLYLVHLPLILVGQAMLRETDLPATVKFALLVVVSTALLLVSYRLFVRHTWLGRALNGPRLRPGDGAKSMR